MEKFKGFKQISDLSKEELEDLSRRIREYQKKNL